MCMFEHLCVCLCVLFCCRGPIYIYIHIGNTYTHLNIHLLYLLFIKYLLKGNFAPHESSPYPCGFMEMLFIQSSLPFLVRI